MVKSKEMTDKIDKKPASYNRLNSTEDDKLRVFANIIIDRIFEDKQLYIESLKKDPNSKGIFDPREFHEFIKKKMRKEK